MELFKECCKVAWAGTKLALILVTPVVLVVWSIGLSHLIRELLILMLLFPFGCVAIWNIIRLDLLKRK